MPQAELIVARGTKEQLGPQDNPAKREAEAQVDGVDTQTPEIVTETLEMRDAGIQFRRPHAADVFRTLCFLYDYQNVLVDDRTFEVIVVKPRKRQKRRAFDNQLRPTFRWLKSEYFKTLPVITAHGAGEDLIDMAAANVASKLSAYWRDRCGWLKAERKACNWVLVAGAAFIAPVWRQNPLSPTTITRLQFNEEPVEAYDPSTDQVVRTYLSEVQEQTFTAGMNFDVYTTLQTFTFPLSASCWDEVQEIITVDLVTKEYVERHLGKMMDVSQLSPAMPEQLNLHQIERINNYVGSGVGLTHHQAKEERYILTQRRIRPNFQRANGRYLILLNNKVLHDGDLPNIKEAQEVDPQDTQNISMGIVPWFAQEQPGRLIPESPIGVLIPGQIQYNDLLTDQAINRQMVGRSKLFYKEGSFDPKEMSNASAEMVKILAGGEQPQYHQGSPLVGLEAEIQTQKNRIQESAGRSPVTQGQNPPQVRSAFQLDILVEKSQVPLMDQIRMREMHAQDVFWLSAAMFRNRASADEVISIYGADRRHEVLGFLTANFRHDLKVTEGSALPVNKASQEAKIVELLRYNLFTDENGQVDRDMVLDMLRLGKVDPKVNIRRLTRAMVENENFDMLNGMVQMPFEYEDHALHLERHEAFMTRREFREAPPKIKTIFLFHHGEHTQLNNAAHSAEAAGMQMEEENAMRSEAITGQPSAAQLPGMEPGLPGLTD